MAVDDASASQAVMRLARVGIENIEGTITSLDGFTSSSLLQIAARDLNGHAVLDVRRRAEFWEGHVTGAINIPLDELAARIDEINRHHPLAVICAGGYRSSIACSLLSRAGFTNVINVQGGTEEWMRLAQTRVSVPQG
jgi:hydroxyacylglutathione hydrolase